MQSQGRCLSMVVTLSTLVVSVLNAQRPTQFPLQAQTRRYHLAGTVIAMRQDARQLVIDAKPIPGYMSAMAVPFPVRDTAVFSELRPGDNISADLLVNAGASWLENVTREGSAQSLGAGPFVNDTLAGSGDLGRQSMDSIGIRPPSLDSIGIKPPTVDSILKPNTMRDSTTLRYPLR